MRPTPASRSRSALLSLFAGSVFALVASAAITEAAAQSSCQTDFERLTATRNARIAAVNALQKKGKGKLDPIAACPRLNALAASEQAMIDYMVKNQKWCSIPEDVVNQARTGSARTRQIACACMTRTLEAMPQAWPAIWRVRAEPDRRPGLRHRLQGARHAGAGAEAGQDRAAARGRRRRRRADEAVSAGRAALNGPVMR